MKGKRNERQDDHGDSHQPCHASTVHLMWKSLLTQVRLQVMVQ